MMLRVFVILLASVFSCVAQEKSGLRRPPPLDTAQALRQGKELTSRLLQLWPEGGSTNRGELRIRSPGAKVVIPIPLRISITASPDRWTTTYEAGEPGAATASSLTVVRIPGTNNLYLLKPGSDPNSAPRPLANDQVMAPFAGSDFWMGDLGLEFLHWPTQLLLKHGEMRRGQSCDVLESANPNAGGQTYSRVVSWIDIDTGGIVHADAYDAKNQLLKQFAPKEFKKVQGQWQVEEMEMRNRQTGSRTEIKFDLK